MTEKKWPDDYPPEMDLPPHSAEEISARLYRFVNNSQPTADDFLPSYKDPEQAHLVNKPAIRRKAAFYATSFFSTEESIRAKVEELPQRFEGKLVACGNVKPEHGKGEFAEQTHHVSVWFYVGVYPQGFSVI
jgi:hypothetical protein